MLSSISTVVFDVGETLIDETRMWAGWARYLDVPLSDFLVALDEAVQAGAHHRTAITRFRPGLEVDRAMAERMALGELITFDSHDLYPDALPCLQELRALGFQIGIAGNQPRDAERALREIGFAADFIASSAGWGVEKPSPEFFAKVVEAARVPAARIAYIGDRLDNDVLPARAAGMVAVFIERGPWGRVHAQRPEVAQAHLYVRSLAALPDAMSRFQRL